MKHIFLVLISLIITNLAIGQLTKGHWLAGGSARFYSYKNKYQTTPMTSTGKYTQIDLSPNVGYFLADKFALGIKSTVSYLKGKYSVEGSAGAQEWNEQRYLFGAFGRYYFLESGKQTNLLVDASYQIGFIRGLNDSKGKLNNFSISAGPVVYFNSFVGAEFLLGYAAEWENYTSVLKKEKKNGLKFSIGLQLHLIK